MWQPWEIDPDFKIRNEERRRAQERKKTKEKRTVNQTVYKKPESVTHKRQWLWEFSKKIVVLVAIAFFISLAYVFVFLLKHPDSTAINGVFDNITNIFTGTVIAYAVKAGFENVFKIIKSPEEKEEDENNE